MDFFEAIGSKEVIKRLEESENLWLFLDYDGTLADFAPTPDHVIPDPTLIEILTRLANVANIQTAIVSGRRLEHIQKLAPVPGFILAGTYGIEIQNPDGEVRYRLNYEKIRPSLDQIKPDWEDLILNKTGFYLEDKGWSLAIHARYASEIDSGLVLDKARDAAVKNMDAGKFRLLGGHRFLEISPLLANKGGAVEFLLQEYPFPEALPVYIGDDDKDEEAFEVVNQHSGVAILVTADARPSQADLRIKSPEVVREWLITLYK
jgi:trehalose-phosphatase